MAPARRRQPRAPDDQSISAPRGRYIDSLLRPETADRESSLDIDLDEVDWDICLGQLGSALRDLRESAGLSQRDLARFSGVSQGAVSRFEVGRRRAIPAHVMLKIAVALARHPGATDQPLADAVRRLLSALVRLVRDRPSS